MGEPLKRSVSWLPGVVQNMFMVIRGLISRPFIGIVMFAIGVALTTCFRPPAVPATAIPDGWQKREFDHFSFYVPPDVQNERVRGIDSAIWESGNSTMSLVFDYGYYSTDLQAYASQPEYHAEWYRIGGRMAKLETIHMSDGAADWDQKDRPYLASVYFPDVGNGRAKLTFRAHCMDPRAQESAKTILLSIRFK